VYFIVKTDEKIRDEIQEIMEVTNPGTSDYIPPDTQSISGTTGTPYAPVTQSIAIIPVPPCTWHSLVLC